MKRYFGIIVAVVFVIVAIVFTMRKWEEKTTETKRELAAAKLRQEYLERVAWIRNVPGQKAYNDEVNTFLRWYFKEVNEHVNEFRLNRNFDDYLLELEEKTGKKSQFTEYESGPTKDRSADKKAAYEATRKLWDTMKGGSYSAWWTATSNGVRLDILSADSKGDQIHMPVVAWGLPREERVDDKKVRRVVTNGNFKFNWKLFDEKGKLIAEIPGDGGPNGRVDWPERYMKFFPSMVVFGSYDIDKLPPETKTAEISWTISARSPSGGDINANYLWKGEVPADWKLAPGETWKGAQESIRPEEEIDPSKQAKK
ncbi:MAG: hypothetical protein MUC96_18980 [Myxococcaceae bacterium]|jgi:hypothetical protein|nr:hypothetical protein [Myxococcaceae bacterium]